VEFCGVTDLTGFENLSGLLWWGGWANKFAGELHSPWQLPDGNCFLAASSSLHPNAVCAKRKLRSWGAERPKPFPPVTGRYAPPSLGISPGERDCCFSTLSPTHPHVLWSVEFPSRRAGLLFFHQKKGRIFVVEVFGGFHPGERDCCFSTRVS